MKKGLLLFLLFIVTEIPLLASDTDLYSLAEDHYRNREYYGTITELMRLRTLYPSSPLMAKSMLLAGKAYYAGGSYAQALTELEGCFNRYKERSEGEAALNFTSFIRLKEGSALYALYAIQIYQQTYPEGKYLDEAILNRCYISAFTSDLYEALDEVKRFKVAFPRSRLSAEAGLLEKEIINEINRPKKSLFVSVGGSILIPGFGHFYTGHYTEGLLSFVTTTLLAYLAYDGYRDRNSFRMIFFGVAGFMFYQNSMVSAVNNVNEWNSREAFFKRVKLSLSREF